MEDEFEDQSGWDEIGTPGAPEKETPAPSGKSVHSRIELSEPDEDDDEEERDDEQDEEEERKPKKGKTEEIDYDQLAERIAMRQRVQQQPQQPQRPQIPQRQYDELDIAVQELRASGADQQAINHLLKLVDGYNQRRFRDEENARAVQERQRNYESFHQSLNESFESAIDDATNLSPKLSKLKAAITEAVVEEWKKKEYDGERAKIDNLRKPDPKAVARAVQKVRDRFAKDYGLQSSKPPIQVKSSRPTATKGGSTQNQISRLDAAQRAYFDVFRKDLGDERALQSAKKIKSA